MRLVRFVRPQIGGFLGVWLGQVYLGVILSWYAAGHRRCCLPLWTNTYAAGTRVLHLGPFWLVW